MDSLKMAPFKYFLLLFLTVLIIRCQAQNTKYQCGNGTKTCSCQDLNKDGEQYTNADCSGREIESIPSGLPEAVTCLDLSNNKLSRTDGKTSICKRNKRLVSISIANNDLKDLGFLLNDCRELEILDMTGNRLELFDAATAYKLNKLNTLKLEVENMIGSDVLENMPMLTYLELTCQASKVEARLFHRLNSLASLVMSLPGVSELPEEFFLLPPENLGLESLSLTLANAKELLPNLFEGMMRLKYLRLHLPSLRELQINQTWKPQHLKTLAVSGPQKVNEEALKQLTSLKSLSLEGIRSLVGDNFFHGPVNLKSLEIVNCALKIISSGWFSKLSELTTLVLRNNGLTLLQGNPFQGLVSLQSLDLSYNNIESIKDQQVFSPIGNTLEELVLTGNKLVKIQASSLSPLTSLTYLELSNNMIATVESDTFHRLENLRAFFLRGNNLETLNVSSLNRLQKLDLSDNLFKAFPLSVLRPSLTQINVSGNAVELPASELCKARSLRTVYASGMSLHCDCSLQAVPRCGVTIIGACSTPKIVEGYNLSEFKEKKYCVEQTTTAAPSSTTTITTTKASTITIAPATFEKPPADETSTITTVLVPQGQGQESTVVTTDTEQEGPSETTNLPSGAENEGETPVTATSGNASNLALQGSGSAESMNTSSRNVSGQTLLDVGKNQVDDMTDSLSEEQMKGKHAEMEPDKGIDLDSTKSSDVVSTVNLVVTLTVILVLGATAAAFAWLLKSKRQSGSYLPWRKVQRGELEII